MATLLANRVSKLEAATPNPNGNKPPRVIRVVASAGDETAARALMRAEGFDPNSDDIGIIRLIALSSYQRAIGKKVSPPKLLSKNW